MGDTLPESRVNPWGTKIRALMAQGFGPNKKDPSLLIYNNSTRN